MRALWLIHPDYLGRTLWFFRAVCVGAVGMCVFIAVYTGDGHWVERSGKVIIALSLLLTYAQFRFEVSYESFPHAAAEKARALLEGRGLSEAERVNITTRTLEQARTGIDSTRRRLLLNALVAVAVGELVSAFGEVVFRLVEHSADLTTTGCRVVEIIG